MTTVVAVIEGVEKSLLSKVINGGGAPWFQSAQKEGRFFDLDTGVVPYEPSNLATAFSGVGPGHHGCFSYWKTQHAKNSKPRILGYGDVKVPRVWEWDQLKDKTFGVVNVQLTFPPREINGYLISYLMEPTLRATYPKRLWHDLRSKNIRYAHDVSTFYDGKNNNEFASDIFRTAEYQLNTSMEIGSKCDILIVNLTIADRLSHFFWSEIEEEKFSSREPYIIQSYKFLDKAMRRLSCLNEDNDSMLVFSEIGFGPIDSFVSLDLKLQQAGLQQLSPNGSINYQTSVACEAVQGSHGINILNSHQVSGASSVEVAYNEARKEVVSCLLNAKFDNGKSILKDIQFREDVYKGPNTHLAPDLIVEPEDPRRPPLGEARWAKHVNRYLQTGWHRAGGFGIYEGGKTLIETNTEFNLESIAPSVAIMIGREYPDYCSHGPFLR